MEVQQFLPIILFLIGVSLVFLFKLGRKRETNLKDSNTDEIYPIPSNRETLTTYLKKHYLKIELIKRRTMHSKRISKDTDTWAQALGQRICDIGVHTYSLDAKQKFAAVFLVNRLFHNGHSDAEKMKNYLLRTIVLYHRDDASVKLKLVIGGKYNNTYEITCSPWTTHLPRYVVEDGSLERPGKPNAKKTLKT